MTSPHARGFPLFIGVTGHRDIEPDSARELVRAVNHQLRRLVEAIRFTEICILSGMAPGADLIVARAAVEAGVRVEAVLPMPLARYLEDFDATWRLELEELLAHPLVRRVELTPTGNLDEQGGRDASYLSLGSALARRSSLLLAVWDGHSTRLPGGTSDTVLHYLGCRGDAGVESSEPVFVTEGIAAQAGDTAVYWVPVRRASRTAQGLVPKACFLTGAGQNRLMMHGDLPEAIAADWRDLDRVNREYQRLLAEGRVGPRAALLESLPVAVRRSDQPLLEAIDGGYAVADSLAMQYQKGSDRLFQLFGVLTLLMGAVYLCYERLFKSSVVLVVYLVVLAVSFVIFSVLRRKDWFTSHLASRTLAESLRVRFYLTVAGADHLVFPQELFALSGIDAFRGFGWVRAALRSVERTDAAEGPPGAEAIAAVNEAWIGNQHAYFVRKVTLLGASQQRVQRFKKLLLGVMLAVVVALVLLGERLEHLELLVPVSVKDLMMLVWGGLAVVLGVWELHQDKMATVELLWQYRNQADHFARASAELKFTTGPASRRGVVAELGRNSLMESYLWAIHRYHREHEPPSGK
jgi:hypothetical protein